MKLLYTTFCIFWLCPTLKTLKSSCSRSCVLFCLDFFSLYYWSFLSGFSACLLVFCFIYSLWQTAVLFFFQCIYLVYFLLPFCLLFISSLLEMHETDHRKVWLKFSNMQHMRRFKIRKNLPSHWYLEEKLKQFKQISSEENLLKVSST